MTDPTHDQIPPEPAIFDIRDRPPSQHSDDVRDALDRAGGALGVAGDPMAAPGDAAPSDAVAMGMDDDGGHDGEGTTTGGTA